MPPVPPGGLNLSVGKWRVEKSYLKMVIKHDVSYPMIIPTSWSFLTKDFTQKKKHHHEIPIRSNTGDAGNERGPAKALGLTIAGTPVWIIPAAPGGAGSDWFGRP